MKKSSAFKLDLNARAEIGSKTILPALVVVGGGLVALPASALELGEAKVGSSLGQPLRASIAYALAPNEALSDSCVSLQGGMSASGVPTVRAASINVSNGLILVSGTSVVSEPLIAMRVNIRCPYTPRLSREFMLFVDPAAPVSETVVTPAAVVATPPTTAVAAPTAIRRRTVSQAPIDNATRYRVQPGDSLSEIAQRIENRPIALWDAVAVIFDANPSAFVDDDPNKLKAGSWLTIPDFGAAEAMTIAAKNVSATSSGSTAATADADANSTNPSVTAAESAGLEVSASVEPVTVDPAQQPDEQASDTSAAGSSIADLKPGDIIPAGDDRYTTVDDTSTIIADTALEGPVTTSISPNVPTAAIKPPSAESTSTNWLLWLSGGGLLIIAALVLFGRRVRGRFGSTPIAAVATPQRRQTDDDTQTIEVSGPLDAELAEIELPDDSPTEENLALDADLVVGTGLRDGADVDVAQDFGFAATTELDLELPEEMSSGGASHATGVFEPISLDGETTIETEMFGDDDDDDEYDMSVIIDATKMPDPDDVTEKDLAAIAVDTDNEPLQTDDYTVSQEVDYKIIEQDYEDELTATQALNAEIAKAAIELAAVEGDDVSSMSSATITELDVTTNLAAKNDDIGDLDEFEIDHDVTISLSGEEETVAMDREDKTVEMPARENDQTVEMPAKSGTKNR